MKVVACPDQCWHCRSNQISVITLYFSKHALHTVDMCAWACHACSLSSMTYSNVHTCAFAHITTNRKPWRNFSKKRCMNLSNYLSRSIATALKIFLNRWSLPPLLFSRACCVVASLLSSLVSSISLFWFFFLNNSPWLGFLVIRMHTSAHACVNVYVRTCVRVRVYVNKHIHVSSWHMDAHTPLLTLTSDSSQSGAHRLSANSAAQIWATLYRQRHQKMGCCQSVRASPVRCTHKHTHIYMCPCVHICMYMYIDIWYIYIYTYVSIYIYIDVDMDLNSYLHIGIHV